MKKFYCAFFAFFFLMVIAALPSKAQSIETYIHPRAEAILPIIKEETSKYAPGLKSPWVIPAIMDHETCPGYKSSKCFNTTAELRTQREQGLGLGQLTRTWNTNGTIRFDSLANMRRLYPKELGELDWDTFKNRTDLQVRSTTLLFYEDYKRLHTVTGEQNRLRMARSAYNGGGGRVATARSKCKLTTNCNPQWWFDNVELHLPQSRSPMKGYGNRSPYEINTHYVRDTERRLNKYKPYFQ